MILWISDANRVKNLSVLKNVQHKDKYWNCPCFTSYIFVSFTDTNWKCSLFLVVTLWRGPRTEFCAVISLYVFVFNYVSNEYVIYVELGVCICNIPKPEMTVSFFWSCFRCFSEQQNGLFRVFDSAEHFRSGYRNAWLIRCNAIDEEKWEESQVILKFGMWF